MDERGLHLVDRRPDPPQAAEDWRLVWMSREHRDALNAAVRELAAYPEHPDPDSLGAVRLELQAIAAAWGTPLAAEVPTPGQRTREAERRARNIARAARRLLRAVAHRLEPAEAWRIRRERAELAEVAGATVDGEPLRANGRPRG